MYLLGVSILIFGLAFLLRNLGVLTFSASFWSVFYPVVIIAFGIGILCITHEGRKLLKRFKKLFLGEEK